MKACLNCDGEACSNVGTIQNQLLATDVMDFDLHDNDSNSDDNDSDCQVVSLVQCDDSQCMFVDCVDEEIIDISCLYK